MANVKVIIVGAGIVGPVLAVFLKMKGYDPVIYETSWARRRRNRDHPNGMRVLSLIPELLKHIPGHSPDRMIHCSCLNEVEDILVDSDISPATMRERYGFPNIGVRRPEFQQLLIDTAQRHGVEIKWGHQAIEFEQSEDAVEVTFANGTKDTASFVVGCDGLHSNTRIALFGKEKARFTGMVRVGGVSPTPPVLQGSFARVDNYGDGRHMIAYPVAEDDITTRGAEAKENWRMQNAEQQNEIRNGPFSAWGFGAGDLVKTGQKIVRYGLYDRPELESWFKGRIVLLGDAAHPTTPHLGQGANQAFEDIYHFMRLLGKHNPSADKLSTELLLRVFTDYQDLRLLRTSELVREARRQGEIRVVEGVEASRRASDEMLSGPFTESEM
ncbi:FAD/NAD(P)-binding domain-containing protein [Suillus hirtellus]|nr:FAD/NAD(P)-binding domain-containing protein [Suillus hirtellus]